MNGALSLSLLGSMGIFYRDIDTQDANSPSDR